MNRLTIPAVALACIAYVSAYGQSSNPRTSEITKGNRTYIAMSWKELPLGGMLSDDAAFRGRRVVTTTTTPGCDAWLTGGAKFAFRGFSPNGGWYENINIFPQSLSKPGQPFPTDGLGRPWAGSVSPWADGVDPNSWKSVPGFNQSVAECEKYISSQFGTSPVQFPGFLVFGVIERQGSYNALVVEGIEFANYANGFWASMNSTLTEDKYAVFLIELLRKRAKDGN